MGTQTCESYKGIYVCASSSSLAALESKADGNPIDERHVPLHQVHAELR